jgi:hypothetical protein
MLLLLNVAAKEETVKRGVLRVDTHNGRVEYKISYLSSGSCHTQSD